MDPLVGTGIAIGVELIKFALEERNLAIREEALRKRMTSAGIPGEVIEAELKRVRAEIAALPSPTTLPEV